MGEFHAGQEHTEDIFADRAYHVKWTEMGAEYGQYVGHDKLTKLGGGKLCQHSVAIHLNCAKGGVELEMADPFPFLGDSVVEAHLAPDSVVRVKPESALELLIPVAMFRNCSYPLA